MLFNMTICFCLLKFFNNAYYTSDIYIGNHIKKMRKTYRADRNNIMILVNEYY